MQALRALQEIDRDLYKAQAELRRLPAERDRRQNELTARQAQVDQAKEQIVSLQLRVKEIEGMNLTHGARIRKLEKESLSQRDMAVVEACRYEMRSLKRQIDEAEREGLEFVEQAEALEARIEELSEQLAADRTAFETFLTALEVELTEAQGRHDELCAKRRERMSDTLSPETLSLYDRLIDARDGEAMAALEGNICQACYMEVMPNLVVRLARGQGVVQCPSCDRILYRA
ncbi:MAG: C4-type zinc ribbon domain-containing protein [Planctomycetota bacterium]|nr:C4-type zinc ribbon domain-containing protein [Planctomycetota bacterium]MDP6764165.1 C4-type zinc ribbon domain-containing protein [Planctomycetota bacterium]MDP6989636.1 C4-type zinc ribbon domain-containing protein [Planctomycetota bacterium]